MISMGLYHKGGQVQESLGNMAADEFRPRILLYM